MTPEAKVKASVVKMLKEMDAYYFFPVMGGFGRSGVPDIIGCSLGLFIAIECKAGKNKTTALQDRELASIRKAGGFTFVANENNLDELRELLCQLNTTRST
jgi:Holliday junction resolvase